MANFSGKWHSTFGPMSLRHRGLQVRGSYVRLGVECFLEGRVDKGKLHFTYQEPGEQGRGYFELTRGGRAFSGAYQPVGATGWYPWSGERVGFDGLWDSSFGLLRLIEEDDAVLGYYEIGGRSTIRGRRQGDRLTFRYREPDASGEGRFALTHDGMRFEGRWRPKGEKSWRPWEASRVIPQPNLTWLVVFEVPWQRYLVDREYAFGAMLREFFARLPHVRVRHRFFINEAGLRRCFRDLLYLAEPAVVVVASHALPEGIRAGDETISLEMFEEPLRQARNVRLLHFSACLLLREQATLARLQTLCRAAGVAISGYATSVNWAASAVIEFLFLELVLGQGLSPAEAADQLLRLIPIAGDKATPGTAFRPAGFRIVLPDN